MKGEMIMKNKKYYIGAVIGIISLFFYLVLMRYSFKNKLPLMEYKENNNYLETLIVVTDVDFEPYSFIDNKNKVVGFDVELIYSLGEILKKNIDLRLLPWSECIKAIEKNEADLILGVVTGSKYTQNIYSSIPVSKDSFVLFGTKKYSNFDELYDKKIAYLKGSDSKNLFLKPYKLDKKAKGYNSYGEAFKSIKSGENDFILATYSVGRRLGKKYGDINAVGQILVNKMFSIGVSENNKYLIEELDKAIIQRQRDGTIEKLTSKWLKRYIEVISFKDFLLQHSMVLVIFIAIILLSIIFVGIYIYKKEISLSQEREYALLEYVARDSLTKVYNRKSGEQMIKQIIDESTLSSYHAFIMIDIDNFKNINETLGHDGGDEVLVQIAKILKKAFNDFDIVIRMGGDEFSIFAVDYKDINSIEKKLKKLFEILKEGIVIKNKAVTITLSIGVALYPKSGIEFQELYENADKILYEVKNSGKNNYKIL